MLSRRCGVVRVPFVFLLGALLCFGWIGVSTPATAAGFDTTQWVASFYVAYWGRSPDPEGLNYWIRTVQSGQLTTPQVAENFALSDEAKAQYPYLAAGAAVDYNAVDTFIRSLYANLLNRVVPSNDPGVLYWVSELRNGRTTPGAVIGNIIYAAMVNEGQDWDTIRNKVDVALYFTSRFASLNRAWLESDFARARKSLEGVDFSAPSVTEGKRRVDEMLAQGVLVIQRDPQTGTITGTFQHPSGSGKPSTTFSVTSNGEAVIQTQGQGTFGRVVSRVDELNVMSVTLGDGSVLDGKGALTSAQMASLTQTMTAQAEENLAMMALEAGCSGEPPLSPSQLAALLAPWQLSLKYLHADRLDQVARMASKSSCDYYGKSDRRQKNLLLGPATPIPVVFGYMSFDEYGAAGESGATMSLAGDDALRQSLSILDPPTLIDSFGPCGAKCRGACGIDCEFTNCGAPESVWECEKDEDGQNTGNKIRYDVYECGVHEACIAHDGCYDYENAFWGCEGAGSWAAAIRRHWIDWLKPGVPRSIKSCDSKCIADYGIDQCMEWALGLGPYTSQRVFAYSDEASKQEDLALCPLEEPCAPGVGKFPCANGNVICADLVCNSKDDCGDNSDESSAVCGNQNSCCVATNGCPGETATSCAETCCCCPYGYVCDRTNPARGCVPDL